MRRGTLQEEPRPPVPGEIEAMEGRRRGMWGEFLSSQVTHLMSGPSGCHLDLLQMDRCFA